MKKIISLLLVSVIALGTIVNNNINNSTKKKVNYVHLDLAVNPKNMKAYVGLVDYVFVGTITEYIGNFDSNSNYMPFSKYKIEVLQNLKGNLTLNNTVEVKKYGGYDSSGNLVLIDGDTIVDFLPEVGKQYIFMAYGQEDGGLLLAELNGNVEYNNSQSISKKSTDSNDLISKYEDYISEEIKYERTRYKSNYSKN